ncbi:class III lanthionine synthetase LanKC [Streptomyces umbrinus]
MEDYIWYCQTGSDFYDRPRVSRIGNFSLVDSRMPGGWKLGSDDSWTFFKQDEVELAEQGWKVHVSAVPADAEGTIDIVSKYCFERQTPFKVLTHPRVHLRRNSKYASRSSSGKLITIYPPSESALLQTLVELDILLKGRQGPYILSDLRWRNGPLFVRYGGFKEMYTVDDRGRRVLAIRGPHGLVPDVRAPSFRPPSWVKVPEYLTEQQCIATSDSATPMPYVVKKALHFSNGGGIYLAVDPAKDEEVILREARPFAGLDGAGKDSVSRLYREVDTLKDLGDLDFVPTPKGTFTCWEHHFLAQEYIAGQTLWDFIVANNPAMNGTATKEDFAAYACTASEILDQLEHAIRIIHSRGYVYGDLHPRNVMVRPDGRIALVDFEVAYRPGLDPEPTIACPGFVAEHAASGKSRDIYALDCLRVAVFLPVTPMVDLDSGKAEELSKAVTELFPVPNHMTDSLVARLRPLSVRDAVGSRNRDEFAAAARNPHGAQMRTLMETMVRAITLSATPERTDRLFPGDPKALNDGGHTLAHGAAGVLYALQSIGQRVEESHVEWLSAAVQRVPARAGLWEGLHGAALALHGLGREQEAYEALERAAPEIKGVTSLSLYDGLAGIALTLRHMASTTNDSGWQSALDAVVTRVADNVLALGREDARLSQASARAGLMHGLAGAALLFLRRHQDTKDDVYLDLAVRALEIDLKYCRVGASGEVTLAQGPRLMPYLGIGSAGLAEVVSLCRRHRPDERLATWHEGMLRACRVPFTIEPGLLMGRAGLMMVLSTQASPLASRDALADHVRRLAWHAVPRNDASGVGKTLAFPGRRLLRLSMDLASGTAGVLLALNSCARETPPPTANPVSGSRTLAEATGLPLSTAALTASELPGHTVPDMINRMHQENA